MSKKQIEALKRIIASPNQSDNAKRIAKETLAKIEKKGSKPKTDNTKKKPTGKALKWKEMSNADKMALLDKALQNESTPASKEKMVKRAYNFLPKKVKDALTDVGKPTKD